MILSEIIILIFMWRTVAPHHTKIRITLTCHSRIGREVVLVRYAIDRHFKRYH